jgi:hypothetical protein
MSQQVNVLAPQTCQPPFAPWNTPGKGSTDNCQAAKSCQGTTHTHTHTHTHTPITSPLIYHTYLPIHTPRHVHKHPPTHTYKHSPVLTTTFISTLIPTPLLHTTHTHTHTHTHPVTYNHIYTPTPIHTPWHVHTPPHLHIHTPIHYSIHGPSMNTQIHKIMLNTLKKNGWGPLSSVVRTLAVKRNWERERKQKATLTLARRYRGGPSSLPTKKTNQT